MKKKCFILLLSSLTLFSFSPSQSEVESLMMAEKVVCYCTNNGQCAANGVGKNKCNGSKKCWDWNNNCATPGEPEPIKV